MSSIDERVVSMKFNNGQFESGVKQTMSSLDGLKKGLNLDASAKSLEGLDAAGKKFSLQNMADGVQNVASKFSALSVIGITALANITSKAVDAGLSFAKSMTVKPIMDGLKEYETQLNAVQTILANTESKGSTLQDVNGALAELNTYADKTIYNFTEMTRNIGTFTAAGVDLETSTTAIKGIANLAALSGSNSQQASTAMYQLSQALSSGTVKLQDWNSVVNAGMGGQVFQDALTETARANGVAVDSLIEKNGSFRESLQEGWLSADIMTQTLEKMTMATEGATEAEIAANREKLASQGYNEQQIEDIFKMANTATNAATKVKTFTQLMETLEEAVGSGWAKSWEILLGDFEEAKVFFTKVSETLGAMIGASSDARNDLLTGWKELGGREKIIQSLWIVFENLLKVMKPIGEAFKEIFPPVTSQQLADFSWALVSVVEKLTPSEKALASIKSVFKGLFAVLDIGVFIVMKVAGVLKNLFSAAFSGSGVVLDTAGNVGDLLVKFRDLVKGGDGVTKFFNKISYVLVFTIIKIKQFLSAIVGLGTGFKDLDFSSFSSALEGMAQKLNPLKRLGETTGKVWAWVTDALGGLISFFAPFASTMGKLFGGMGKAISDSVQDMDFNAILDLVNTGLLAGIALLIRKFLKGGVPDVGGGLIDSIKGIFGGLTDTMGAMQTQLKAGTLVKIAGAIALLTASVLVLSMIDSGALTKALLALSVMFGQLFISMAIFEKATAGAGFAKMPLVAASMILLGTAILILTAAVTVLSKLSWTELAKGLLGVTVLIQGLTRAVESMAANPAKLISTGIGLMALAVAVKILASAVKDFADMGWADLAKGLVAVGAILGALTLFTKLAKVNKGAVAQSAGLILLGVALKIIASVVDDLSKIPWAGLAKGAATITAILAVFAGFSHIVSPASMVKTGISMVILGGALKILASAFGDFAKMSWKDLSKGVSSMAAALLIIAGAMHLMPKNMIVTAASLVVVAAALKIMAEALKSMGGMSWEEIGKSMVVLAGSLLILAGAMYLMSGALPGALALIVVAGALAILTPALISMSKLSWEEIAKGLVMLAGVFLVLGLAALALTPVIPSLLALGIAVVLLGAGAMLAGVGILAMAVGITALSVAAAAGTAGIVTLISGILGLIPMALTALGEGIIAFAQVIESGVPAIVSAVVAMITALLDAVIELTPKLIETLSVVISGFLDLIIELTPKITEAFIVLLTAILAVVIAMIPQVVTVFTTLVGAILDSISTLIPKAVAVLTALISAILVSITTLIPQGVAIFTTFIYALLSSIQVLMPKMIATFTTMVLAILDSIKTIGPQIVDTFITLVRSILAAVEEISGEIIDTFVRMVFKLVDTLVASVPRFVDSGMRLILGVLNGINQNIGQIAEAGMKILTNLIKGITRGIPDLVSSAIDLIVTFVESLAQGIRDNQSRMDTAGRDLAMAIVDGMTGGLGSAVGRVVESAKNLASNALEGAKNLLGIKSPSREFFAIGEYSGQGLALGIDNMGNRVAAASANMGKTALDEIKTSIGRVADYMDQDMDLSPTISPVLDLTSLKREASNINSMLNAQPFSLESNYASAAAISRANRQSKDEPGRLSETSGETTIFNQYNSSPKALNDAEIYRQSKSLLATKK